ncbi:ABC transporter permease [Clostridium oryzae]|uniref:ABC-2 family transporter protein n=1 Tax=Clostridium oryzae TaxID=1450648 RepID=A0A1V4ITE4_9CLOT|nr:ABC transporter permease [Clostridium oryzae]OPJ63064.1 ABC-2 family transporter protein [Clostridium oryzae]
MIAFLKNNYYRISSRKHYIFISIIMTVISIVAAVYMASKADAKLSLALITQRHTTAIQSKYINFTIMRQKPERYQLILGKYDGIIVDRGNGKFDFETVKGNDFKNMMRTAVQNPKNFVSENKGRRGVGSNIIGYVMMFLLIQSVLFMFMLAEDMELGQIKRIAAAPISFFKYLAANFISILIMIFTPAIITLIIMKVGFAFDIGFSLAQYAAFLLIISFIGIAFAMFITSLVKTADTANMIGNSVVVLTTILAGSFYSFEKGNEFLQRILWVIPQKDYLYFVQGIEEGKKVYNMFPQLSYVIIISTALFIFSIVKIKNDYILKRN